MIIHGDLALELFFSDEDLKRLGIEEFRCLGSEGMGLNLDVEYKSPAYVYREAS